MSFPTGRKWALGMCLLGSTLFCLAADWPQWRGPDRDGKSKETSLIDQWPEGGPSLIWQSTGMGTGYSSISIAGGKILTMGDIGDRQFVIAADQKNGKTLWKTDVGPQWKDNYGGARCTPTIDGDKVYAINTEGGLSCLNLENGKIIWQKSLTKDFGGLMSAGQNVDWKFSESPLVDGNRVIVTPGSNDAALVALDKNSGKEIWRSKIPKLGEKGADGAGYSSVVKADIGGVKQYIQLLGRGVIGVNAETGKFLWGYNKIANDVANIPTPIVQGDHVFVSTGYGTGAALLKIKGSGDSFEAEEVYFLTGKECQNHHGGMVLYKDHIYLGSGHNKGRPQCVEMKSGKTVWGPIRNKGGGSAALTFADGHLYYRYQNGLMVLVEATTEGYKEKGSFKIPEVKQFSWSHPVIVDGKMYLREQDHLFCYDLKKS